MILVDTNVLLDVLEDDPVWASWSMHQLQTQSIIHDAELSATFESGDALDGVIQTMGLKYQELPRPALFLASMAFVQYRRSRGTKHNVLPDFFIGAHAAVHGWAILTRDSRRYRNYFPHVPLITPDPAV